MHHNIHQVTPSEAAVVTPPPLRGVATPAVGTACDLRRRHCACTSNCCAQKLLCLTDGDQNGRQSLILRRFETQFTAVLTQGSTPDEDCFAEPHLLVFHDDNDVTNGSSFAVESDCR